MRILSYNILDGGADRAPLLTQVIERERPDVVGLVEADDPAVVARIAEHLHMDVIHAPGNHKASALLSRFPIRQTLNHAPLHPALTKSLLEAVVVDGAGGAWNVGVLHLHAHAAEKDEAIRDREIQEVLNILAEDRRAGSPHLLMGDFNANAPYQQIDPAKTKKSTREEWQKNGGYLPRRVIQRLLDEGYVDSFRARHPQAAETAGTFSTESPGQRVDFTFTFGIDPSRFREAKVITEPPAKDASDHFPILLEVED